MEFFEKIFDSITELSAKLPAIDLKAIFIITLAAIGAIGIIVGLTFLGSATSKMKRACASIRKYLAGVNEVNEDNAEDFTSKCFGKKTPVALSDSWVEYIGVRYGFPSEIMSETRVFDKEVKKVSYVRANVFIAIALIVNALLAFWGFGCLTGAEIGVTIGLGLLLSAIIYLILVVVARKEFTKARDAFYEMQDDLDAKIDFHVEKSYSTDASPLVEMSAIIDEIIARNTSKEVEMPVEEECEAELAEEECEAEVEEPVEETAEELAEEIVEDEPAEEAPVEDTIVEEPVEELAEEAVEEELVAEEPADEELVAAIVEDEAVEEATADVEEAVEEEVAEAEEEIEEGEDDDMFGRRKKAREAAQQIPQEERTFLESEIVEEEPEREYLDSEVVEGEREYLDSEVIDDETPANQEIVEEEENLDEGDEDVKAPKLAKLPGIADFILSKNLPTKQRIQLAGAMVGLCVKYKKDPDNFKCARKSTAKLLASVVMDKMRERQAQ
ncbi:MAG: hypothetical protein J6S32_00965 [Clostridia bacterium]|nr:hypothetical protein [Clostridia bacterium]